MNLETLNNAVIKAKKDAFKAIKDLGMDIDFAVADNLDVSVIKTIYSTSEDSDEETDDVYYHENDENYNEYNNLNDDDTDNNSCSSNVEVDEENSAADLDYFATDDESMEVDSIREHAIS